jgi:ribose transport system substrate-binding protein
MIGGCSNQSGTSKAAKGSNNRVKVAILANGASDFWRICRLGGDKAAKELGVDLEYRVPQPPTATEQKVLLEDLMARGITGVAISPIDPKHQIDLIDDAAASINVLTTDSDAPGSKRLCYIGTDNYLAGKAAGGLIKKALPKGGKIWIFVGTLDAQNAADRHKGIVDELKGSNVKVLGVITDGADRPRARANAEDAMVKTPDVACLVGLWSYSGPAILDAVKGAGKQGKIKIVCFDEEDTTLQGVKDGFIEGTVVQKPFDFGYQSVRVLAALARKEDPKIPENKIIDTGVQVVDKTNVDAFWTKLKEQTGKK